MQKYKCCILLRLCPPMVSLFTPKGRKNSKTLSPRLVFIAFSLKTGRFCKFWGYVNLLPGLTRLPLNYTPPRNFPQVFRLFYTKDIFSCEFWGYVAFFAKLLTAPLFRSHIRTQLHKNVYSEAYLYHSIFVNIKKTAIILRLTCFAWKNSVLRR